VQFLLCRYRSLVERFFSKFTRLGAIATHYSGER